MSLESRKSFEELAVPHLDAMYRVARRLTRSEHEAEDLVQETFLKAQRAFGTFRMRQFGIRPWLLRILHNTYFNRLARERRAPRPAEQQALEQVAGPPAQDSPPQLDYENLDAEVKRAMDGLQPEYCSVLLLWATMELSYQEIADILQIPIGTVMSRLHRARQALLKSLRDYAREHLRNPVRADG